MGPGGSGTGGGRVMADKGVHVEAAGNHCRVHRGLTYLQAVYRGGEDVGIQEVPMVAGPGSRPHTGGSEGRVKER